MNKKDKDLLIKDISARVFYGVKVNIERDFPNNPQIVERIAKDGEIIVNGILAYDIYYYKSYLRPMSSMTEDEMTEFEKLSFIYDTSDGSMLFSEKGLDWLNEHHFDFRGLIERGLALEAPAGMYNKEEPEKGSDIPIPKTVDEAVKTLAKIVSKEDMDYLLENGAISMHDSLGRWIRNEWGLWTGSELKDELMNMNKGLNHPDDMSNYIIEEFIKYWNDKV